MRCVTTGANPAAGIRQQCGRASEKRAKANEDLGPIWGVVWGGRPHLQASPHQFSKPKARQANSPSYHSEMAALEKALPKFKRCKITQPQLAVLMRHFGEFTDSNARKRARRFPPNLPR